MDVIATATNRLSRHAGPAVRALGRAQARVYRASGGRLWKKILGSPILVLTTTGRKSGQARTTSLICGIDGERFVVIGSNAGSDKPPAWLLNLEANPNAAVQVRGERRDVRARFAEGEERDRLWAMMNGVYRWFSGYQTFTEREIAVVVLEPVS